MKHEFADGKYTVINENDGYLTALRYGEPWQDLTGNHLIYWMLVEVDTLKQQRNELLETLNILTAAIECLGAYASDFFQAKQNLQEDIDKARLVISKVTENSK